MLNGLKIDSNGTKRWYLNNQLHRTDGPAVEYYNGYKYWYINGVGLSEKEYLKTIRKKKFTELLGL